MLNQNSIELLSDILRYIMENEYTHWQESEEDEWGREWHIYEKAVELKELMKLEQSLIHKIKSNMDSTIADAAECTDELSDSDIKEIREQYKTEEEQDTAMWELVIDIACNEWFWSQADFTAWYYAALEWVESQIQK